MSVADHVAFALGRVGRGAPAVLILEQMWVIAPTHRIASSIAYLCYASSMNLARPARKGDRIDDQALEAKLDREQLRVAFRKWIERALSLDAASIRDLYRLGVFEAQIESMHDRVALRCFLSAIDAYRSPEVSERSRSALRKYYARALYAGGRSALRLGEVQLARRLSFTCIREDEGSDYVAPVHKLSLAGRVCLVGKALDHAERAFRLALDADGPPRRDYLFGYLAEVAAARGDLDGAIAWIETHVAPERRDASLWRQLGDLRAEKALDVEAIAAYQAALERDRGGNHLTLLRIGRVQLRRGELKAAERAFRGAIDFRRRRYQSEFVEALEGLADVLGRRNKDSEAREVLARLEAARRTRARR
jgi:tetratricopeptide (TPR) repeat protein